VLRLFVFLRESIPLKGDVLLRFLPGIGSASRWWMKGTGMGNSHESSRNLLKILQGDVSIHERATSTFEERTHAFGFAGAAGVAQPEPRNEQCPASRPRG
jgi:hypothetical protein